MGRVQSINDIPPPSEMLNKVQRRKIREFMKVHAANPEQALAQVKAYCDGFSKFKARSVKFDKEECPTGIEIITVNSTYFFDFK